VVARQESAVGGQLSARQPGKPNRSGQGRQQTAGKPCRASLRRNLIQPCAERLLKDVITEANFRKDLEADSLDLVELIMAFEEEFGGSISDEEAQKIATVGDAVNFLQARGA